MMSLKKVKGIQRVVHSGSDQMGLESKIRRATVAVAPTTASKTSDAGFIPGF